MTPERPLKDGSLKGLKDALKASQPASASTGDVIGRYRLDSVVGRGGTGIIYKAFDQELERTVALKVLRSDVLGPGRLARFYREASASARLTHPHIVKIHEVVAHEGLHVIAMEFIEGDTLAELFKRSPPTPVQIAEILEQVARAVHYAHEQGVIHRDLKPHNILMRGGVKPVLTDFGLAKVEDGQTTLTQTGFVLGTPLYMSPEQVRGTEPVDHRTDIYSLGVLLYEGLTGRVPFTGNDPQQIYHRILDAEPPSLRTHNPELPAELDTIVLQCLQKDRSRRYKTARDLADDLRRWRAGRTIRARAPAWTESAFRLVRRYRTPIIAGLFAVAALAVGAVLITAKWRLDESQAEHERQQRELERRERELSELATRCVRALASGQELARLIEELDVIAVRWPSDARLLVWKGRLQWRLGREAAAEEAFQQALRIDAANAEAHLEMAGLLLRRYHRERGVPTGIVLGGKVTHLKFPKETIRLRELRARAEQHLAAAQGPLPPGARDYADGSLALAGEKVQDASRLLTSYIDHAPWDVEAVQLAARVYYLSGEIPRAEALLRRAAALDPERPELLHDLGRLLTDTAQFEAALPVLESAVRMEARSPLYQTALGEAHAYLAEARAAKDRARAEQHYRKALAAFDQALAVDDAYVHAWAGRGHAHHAMGRYEDVLRDLTEALKHDPNHLPAIVNRGRAYDALEEYDKAAADCTRALELDPDNAWFLKFRGLAYLKAGRFDLAVRDLERSAALFPANAEVWSMIGITRLNQEDPDGAVAAHTQAIKYDSRYAPAYYNRGSAYVTKKEYYKALEDFTRAIDLEGSAPLPWFARGTVRLLVAERLNDAEGRRRELEACVSDLKRFLAIAPGHPSAGDARANLRRAEDLLRRS